MAFVMGPPFLGKRSGEDGGGGEVKCEEAQSIPLLFYYVHPCHAML